MSNQRPKPKPVIVQQCQAIDYGCGKLWEQFPALTEAEVKRESNRFLGVLETDARIDAEILSKMIPEAVQVAMIERMRLQIQQGEETSGAAIDEQAIPTL